MFTDVLRFELSYQLRSRLFLFGGIMFFLLSFMSIASPNVSFGGISGAVLPGRLA